MHGKCAVYKYWLNPCCKIMNLFYCPNFHLSSYLRGRQLENVKNISYHSLQRQSHFSFNSAPLVTVFPYFIDVQLKYTNNNNNIISNVQTSDYAPTMVAIMASYRFNSSRPFAVHTRTREPDFRRLLKHIIIIIFHSVVGFSKSPRSYPLYVYVHVTL